MTGSEGHFAARRGRRAWRALSIGLALALGVTACGTGISLDPTGWHLREEANFDGGDARLADTSDVALSDAGDELDVSLPLSDADASERDITDASEVADQDAELERDVTSDGYVEPGDAGDVVNDATDGSDDASDEMRDETSDVIDPVDAGDGCTVGCGWPDADYYVDARAQVGGDGTKLKPFKTITAAIAAYKDVLGQSKKAYVAAGTYDQALGEKFPLVLRGLSLVGAGRDQTFVVGTGNLVHSEGGAFRDQYLVTVVAGDRLLETVISGISLRPQSPVPAPNYYGVFCDRGNATGEVAAPGGQTKLLEMTVGPGYQASVLATTSTVPSVTGCNVVIRSSLLTGGWAGLRALGCDPVRISGPVVVEMGGPAPSDGNVVSWMQAPNDGAAAVRLEGCVIRGKFENNAFVDSVYGIYIADDGPWTSATYTFTVSHNSFERLTAGGFLATGDWVRVDELSDNRFVAITRAVTQDPGTRAVALSIDLSRLGKVRRNQFIGNDFGVLLSVPGAGGQAPADFGTVEDPGGNVFRCNSALKETGADLALVGDSANPDGTWAGTLHLTGNAWDHAPPTVRSDDPMPNGCDVSTIAVPHVILDVQTSSLATAACPVDRVPGQ